MMSAPCGGAAAAMPGDRLLGRGELVVEEFGQRVVEGVGAGGGKRENQEEQRR